MRYSFLLFFLLPIYLFGQHQITGKVIDEKTKESLAFVNIVIADERLGTSTNIDGHFKVKSSIPIATIKLSYVGYEPQEITINNQSNLLIKMKKTSFALEEFMVLPGINPAERIIKEVIKNRKKHNPEKSLDFKYESYSKMYFTASPNPKKNNALDSNDLKAIQWLDKHHLFMMESVTERKYKQPDKSYEKIVASRVSGLKNPTFSLIASEFQSFSFYNPTLNVLDKSYLNPISPNSINKYLFLIEDTTFTNKDTVYILSFRPRKGKNFDALKGLLYINTDEFALQNVIAEPMEQDEAISIKIQQKYEKINGSWFPVQLNSNMVFNTLKFGNLKMMGIGKSYLKNIEINPEISKKEFGYIETEIDINATKKDAEFWNKYRTDTLSLKEKNTYLKIDSIGKADNLDKKLKGLEALLTGKLPWGVIDININQLMVYNEYEGVRLGMGLQTNHHISKWFSIGGYGAYGFNDKEVKYGGNLDFLIHYKNDIGLNISIKKDVEEPGVVNFYDYKTSMFSPAGSRLFYLSRMNNIDKIEARFKFRTLRYLKVYVFGNQENVSVTNNYFFKQRITNNIILNDQYYTFNEFGVELRYAFKEKVIKTLNSKITKPTNYPIIYAKLEQGIKHFEGEYEYTRVTVRAEKKFYIKNIGKPSFYIEAGIIDGNVPQHKLNSSLGSFKPNSFMIAGQNTFETMLPYEFFSSEYVNVHFRHSFGSLLLKTKKFSPEVILTTSAGFGNLSYKGFHGGEEFNTMEKGFYESGIILNNIFKMKSRAYKLGFGAGAFYRFGPYQLENTADNFAFKLSFGYTL